MKTRDTALIVGVVAIAFVAVIWLVMGQNAGLSTTGLIEDEEGNLVGPWVDKIVNYKFIVSDRFTGADADATIKVYDEQPADWNNPRGKFDNAAEYTVYTASSGAATINKETPGDYFAVVTLSGYNTEFITFSIPDGSGRGDLPDYQSNPDTKAIEMAQTGTTTDVDFAFTLVNDTSAEESDLVLLTVADNTEFRGWKVIVSDEEGFSLDTDGDGTYDEGIDRLLVSVGGVEYVVFEPSRGVDEFDSNDEFTFLIENVKLADGEKLQVEVEIDAATGDYTGANDEVWGEGEGVLSYIKIYNAAGVLFATVDVTA